MTIALTRRSVGALLVSATMPSRADTIAPDPILAAIQEARIAKAELSAAVRAMDDTDPSSVRMADVACHRSWDVRSALFRVIPTTPAGLRALVQFCAADATSLEPESYGALALSGLLRAVDALLEARASPV